MRNDWSHYFMSIAAQIATRATCDRKHVGCVLVRGKRIIATGYNGSMPGLEHCDDADHLMYKGHCIRTSHAEANAIAQAARFGVSVEGATAYCTLQPCLTCAKLLIMSGIQAVAFAEAYTDEHSLQFFQDSNVSVLHMKSFLQTS